MIQRVQTLYLLIALILSSVAPIFISLWENVSGQTVFALDLLKYESLLVNMVPVLFVVSALMSLITIFQFKKRQLQFVLGRLNILINLILLGVLIILLQNLSGEVFISEKGIGGFIPILVIVLIVIANKAIRKDESLVKSVDRIR